VLGGPRPLLASSPQPVADQKTEEVCSSRSTCTRVALGITSTGVPAPAAMTSRRYGSCEPSHPAASRDAVGLSLDDLTSPVDAYDGCQRVAQAAYQLQLQLHGILAPAAGGAGETLALFEHHLPPAEFSVVLGRETWERLPADPRRLRSLPGGAAGGAPGQV